MEFELRVMAAGFGQGSSISEEEYRRYGAARARQPRALDIEDKLDLLLENYVECEETLLSVALRGSLFRSFDWVKDIGQLHLINRRVTNLLSSAKLYVDQVKHGVSEFFGTESPEYAQVKAFLAAEYGSSLEYRIGEALRNFAQHRGLPVHVLGFPASWENRETAAARLRCGFSAFVLVATLEDEGGFKAKVLEELTKLGVKIIDLTRVMRLYVQGLGAVHERVREMLDATLSADEAFMAELQGRARNQVGASEEDPVSVVTLGPDDEVVEERPFVQHFTKRRAELRAKNRNLSSLGLRYVSGESGEHRGEA